MAKRLFLAVLVLLFGFNAFSQPLQGSGTAESPYLISSKSDFEIFKNMTFTSDMHFKQTVDIDLESRNLYSAIVSNNFLGTYDGDGHTITYQATFTTSGQGTSYAIFGGVYGTIKNLNVNGNITVSGGGQDLRCALLCGYLNGGTIESCNVIGNVNSTADVGAIGSSGTGLIVGRCDGTIQYCTGSGNVTGPGYVGGIAGQLGGLVAFAQSGAGHVKGCSFVGSVTATPGGGIESALNLGSFAGGICGFATNSSIIELCYVKADIVATEVTTGVGGTTPSGWESIVVGGRGKPTVRNNYCEGTVNGDEINTQAEITNSYGSVSGNYYGGQKSAQDIADSLNNAAAGDEKINFDVVDGEVVFGKVNKEKVCETPNNLSISNIDGVYTAIWHNPGADDTMEEGEWHLRLTGGNDVDYYSTINNTTISSPLPPSPNPYVFTVYTYCPLDNSDSIISQEVSATFGVACPIPTNLQVTDLSYNSFVATWQSNADCQLTVNENAYTISQSNSMSQMITGLTPETEYSVSVKAKCGGDYLEEITTIATTTKIPAPTNLMVSTVWNETSGSATMTWELPEGFLFEVETENNPEMSQQVISDAQYSISNLAPGSYTAKVRATKEINSTIYYSDWVEVPYTISAIPAPSNPQITFTPQQDGTVEVKVDWSAGSNESVSWEVKVGDVIFALTTNSPTHTFTQREAGETFVVKISERIGESQSEALVVPITVPCSQAIVPNSILTTQTSVTMNWETANANRKVIINSIEYTVDETTITISGLEVGTPYTYEVREYCLNDNYSSENGIFTTVGCYAVKNVSAEEIGVKNARITWVSQSSLDNLNYNVVLKQGETVVLEEIQTEKSKSFTNLLPSTTYVVEIQEQCGEGWGAKSTFTFTTESGSYVSSGVEGGRFNEPSTWEGGKVPTGNVGTITIQKGHIVMLSHKLVLENDCQIINDGVLIITQYGELINTTENNVGGIVEIETPIKEKNNWTFIGAPFAGYKLECIKPAPSADISISKYDYTQGDWSNEWATVSTEMEAAEGYFAWPFYRGVVTYTTYGDVCVKNEDTKIWEEKPYDFNKEPATELNNADIIDVNKTLKEEQTHGGYWMALSNPYPFKLKVATFLADNSLSTNNPNPNSNNVIQGEVIYKFNGTSWTTHNSGDINMTEGFFVNFTNGGAKTATFKKTQRLENQAKSSRTPREFVKFALVDGKKEIDLLFAHNEKSENDYDIYDANKMFSPVEIAEPYFVTNGLALVKEEVKELPYYATMNVRSYKDTVMSFVMKDIPSELKVFIIDGEEMIEMFEGSVYTTEFSKGENIDRFKLFVRKADALDLDTPSSISITNCNRLVNIQTKEDNLYVEVYNALGQKVYSTREYNFNLNDLPAGSYVVKAYNKRANESVKIVIN